MEALLTQIQRMCNVKKTILMQQLQAFRDHFKRRCVYDVTPVSTALWTARHGRSVNSAHLEQGTNIAFD